jgi:hypothetical protein
MTPDYRNKPCVIMAGGPSVTEEQCEIVRVLRDADVINVIVVNDAYRLVPNASALVAADQPWWKVHLAQIEKTCPRVPRWSCDPRACEFGATSFHVSNGTGIEKPGQPTVKRGSSSGFMAIGLAIRWGATHICLVGFDAKPGRDGRPHWFGAHPPRLPVPPAFDRWPAEYDSLAEPAAERGIRIAQCSIETATTKLIRSTLAAELL